MIIIISRTILVLLRKETPCCRSRRFFACKRQCGLDPYTFIISLLACATSVCFVSAFCLVISCFCLHVQGKMQ